MSQKSYKEFNKNYLKLRKSLSKEIKTDDHPTPEMTWILNAFDALDATLDDLHKTPKTKKSKKK